MVTRLIWAWCVTTVVATLCLLMRWACAAEPALAPSPAAAVVRDAAAPRDRQFESPSLHQRVGANRRSDPSIDRPRALNRRPSTKCALSGFVIGFAGGQNENSGQDAFFTGPGSM